MIVTSTPIRYGVVTNMDASSCGRVAAAQRASQIAIANTIPGSPPTLQPGPIVSAQVPSILDEEDIACSPLFDSSGMQRAVIALLPGGANTCAGVSRPIPASERKR